MKLLSLRHRRLLLPMLLVTLPIFLIAVTALFSLEKTVRSMAHLEARHAMGVMQDAMQKWQDHFGLTAKQIAQTSNLAPTLQQFKKNVPLQAALVHTLQTNLDKSMMDVLLVTDHKGRGLATTDRPTVKTFDVPLSLLGSILTQQTPFVSLINLNEIPTWVAGVPLFNHQDGEKNFTGVLILTKKLDDLFVKQFPQNNQYPLGLWYDQTLIMATHPLLHQVELPINRLLTIDKDKFFTEQQEIKTNSWTLAWLPLHSTQGAFLGSMVIGLENSPDNNTFQRAKWLIVALSCVLIILASGIGWLHERRMSNALALLDKAAQKLMAGEEKIRIPDFKIAEIARLGVAFNTVAEQMEQQKFQLLENKWLQEGMTTFHKILGKNNEMVPLCTTTVTFLTTFLESVMGAFYVVDENGTLHMLASHAYHARKTANNLFIPGEGLVGQVLLEKKHLILSRTPKNYLTIQSGLGEGAPTAILIFPFLLQNKVIAILELGTLTHFSDSHLTFLTKVAESVSMAITASQARLSTQETLEQLQKQRKTVEEQTQALRLSNTTLEEQKQALQLTQAQLLEQQEELRVSNEELEEQAQLLEEQKHEADRKNAALLIAQKELQQHTKELQLANQYKSEFLSNMSHELRTPLNSLLILAKSFMENDDNNLLPRQIADARIIHESGSDLLHLINEILDLSKIEAGRMTLTTELLDLPSFASDLIRRITPMAANKGLQISLEISTSFHWQPFRTDSEKLERILKNLLSNAFKFTKQGWVKLRFTAPPSGWSPPDKTFPLDQAIAISVTDTGIGIPQEKRRLIFEAFQQADGSISRQYGGTGLGLTISTQLARMLGGIIHLESTVGKGSVFTLIIPPLPPHNEEMINHEEPLPPFSPPVSACKPASILTDEQPLPVEAQADLYPPPTPIQKVNAVILPDSCSPATPCALLLVEDDVNARAAMLQLLRHHPIKVTQATNGAEAIGFLLEKSFDCMILDLGLPDINGFDLLDQMAQKEGIYKTPVIVYSGRELTRDEYDRLKKHTDSIVVKGANSPTRLLNEMAILLTKTPPASKAEPLQTWGSEPPQEQTLADPELTGKIILLVDDDVRNIYAMTRQLEQHKIKVHMASNGVKALESMEKNPEIECILMDVMMPVMDGLEAIRQLRARPASAILPIIALTAKATDDDRHNALTAGANDYLPKPVDMALLFTKLKTWMSPQ